MKLWEAIKVVKGKKIRQSDQWEEYIDPKLVELPPHPSFGFVQCTEYTKWGSCRRNYSLIVKIRNWINNLYKDKK